MECISTSCLYSFVLLLIVDLTVALDDVLSPATLPSHWRYHRGQVVLHLYISKTTYAVRTINSR